MSSAQTPTKHITNPVPIPNDTTLEKIKEVDRLLLSDPEMSISEACRQAKIDSRNLYFYYRHPHPTSKDRKISPEAELVLTSSKDGKSIFWDSLNEIESFVEQLPEHELQLMDERILAENPRSYRSIAEEWDISVETARRRVSLLNSQLENKLKPFLDTISALIKDQIGGHIVPAAEFDQVIGECFAGRDPKDGSRAHKLIFKHLGYVRHKDSMFSRSAVREAQNLSDSAKIVADDDDAGLVDEDALVYELISRDSRWDTRWDAHWDALIDYAGLIKVHDHLTQKDTQKARIKAALLNINRPATQDEIATVSGIPAKKLRDWFRCLPTIVRADKKRWALDDWVYKPYEGIWKEIQNLIDESGGSAPLEWVISEMKQQFGSKEKIVKAYARSDKFAIENGNIRLAHISEIKLRELEKVITGRDSRGYPYWTFKAIKQFFRGYANCNFPKEIAAELGCTPDSKISAEVLYPDGANKNLSVMWPLSNRYGNAYLTHMDESLRLLNAQEGMKVRLVIRGKKQVELRLEEPDTTDTTDTTVGAGN